MRKNLPGIRGSNFGPRKQRFTCSAVKEVELAGLGACRAGE